MLRWPSEFTQMRPLTLSVRSVPSASMRSSRRAAQPLDQRLLEQRRARARRGPGRAGRGTSRGARRRRSPAAPSRRRPRPPGVGHSVEHQRFFSVRSRTGRRARATRAIRAGSTPASSRGSYGAWMPSTASRRLGLGHREVVEVVEVEVAGVRVEAARLAGQLDVEAHPGVALEDRALQLEQQRRRERRSSARRSSGRGCTSRQ